MEAVCIGFVFIGYILLRLMLGHHRTPTMRDKKKHQDYINQVTNKEYTDVLPKLEKALLNTPESAICWLLKVACHLGLREYHQAILYADKARNIDDNLYEIYYYKALAYFHLSFFEEALAEFNKAIWYSREQCSDAFYYKGLLLLKYRENENACRVFEKAIKLGHEKANNALLRLRNNILAIE